MPTRIAAALALLAALLGGAVWSRLRVPTRHERAQGDAFFLRGFQFEWRVAANRTSFLELGGNPATGAASFAIRGSGANAVDRAYGETRTTGARGVRAIPAGAWQVEGGTRTVSIDLLRHRLFSERVAVAIGSVNVDTRRAGVEDGVAIQALEARIDAVWREGTDLKVRLAGGLSAGIGDRELPPTTDFWPTIGIIIVPVPEGGTHLAGRVERDYASLDPLGRQTVSFETPPGKGDALPLLTGFSWRFEESGRGSDLRGLELDLAARRDAGDGRASVTVSERLSNEGSPGLSDKGLRVRSRVEFALLAAPGIETSRGLRGGRADIP